MSNKINPSKKAMKRTKARIRNKAIKDREEYIKSFEDFASGFNVGWDEALEAIERRSNLKQKYGVIEKSKTQLPSDPEKSRNPPSDSVAFYVKSGGKKKRVLIKSRK